MKVNNGSMHRKGAKLYLVIRIAGCQKWIALKTGDMSVAMERARQIMRGAIGEETDWLRHLVKLGEAAHRQIAKKGGETPTWDFVLVQYIERTHSKCSESCKSTYRRWLSILKERVGDANPADITAENAHRAIEGIAEKYISCRRMVGFFRHCWEALRLDASIWELDEVMKRQVNESGKSREYFRRFTIDEVRRMYRHLRETSPGLANMFAIGYLTGLRLSDVAELDTSEVDGDGATLRIIPNKTRKRKRLAITTPLVHEAAEIVKRLKTSILDENGSPSDRFGANAVNGGLYLFPPELRHRPSRCFVASFAKCGIKKTGFARASFHSLRATFISMMDEAGIPPHLTDAMTGHGGGGMHARYTQPSLDALRAALLKALPSLS